MRVIWSLRKYQSSDSGIVLNETEETFEATRLGPIIDRTSGAGTGQLHGEIIIGVYSDSRHRPYQQGQSVNVLWAVPVESEWIVTGVVGKRDYDAQIEVIRKIRPNWPNKFESPRHGSATFFTLMEAQ
jgi:hypothetical protein